MSNIADKIWLTAHTRMISESRLRSQGRLWNLLIIWYSVGLSILAIYQLTIDSQPNLNLASAILSVSVLSLSIYIPTLDFDQQAEKFRTCYLRLQRLLDECDNEERLNSSYHNILETFPNHPDKDWITLIISHALNGAILTSNGINIPTTKITYVRYYAARVLNLIMWLTLFAAPVIVYIVLIA